MDSDTIDYAPKTASIKRETGDRQLLIPPKVGEMVFFAQE
jgi:hypothetical protein